MFVNHSRRDRMHFMSLLVCFLTSFVCFVDPVRSPRPKSKIYLYNQSSKKDVVIYYKIRSNAGQHFHVQMRFCTSNHRVIVTLTFCILARYARFARSLVTLGLDKRARSKVLDSLIAKLVLFCQPARLRFRSFVA